MPDKSNFTLVERILIEYYEQKTNMIWKGCMESDEEYLFEDSNGNYDFKYTSELAKLLLEEPELIILGSDQNKVEGENKMEERQFIMAYIVTDSNNTIQCGIISKNAIDAFQALGLAYRDLTTKHPTSRVYINSNMCSVSSKTTVRPEN